MLLQPPSICWGKPAFSKTPNSRPKTSGIDANFLRRLLDASCWNFWTTVSSFSTHKYQLGVLPIASRFVQSDWQAEQNVLTERFSRTYREEALYSKLGAGAGNHASLAETAHTDPSRVLSGSWQPCRPVSSSARVLKADDRGFILLPTTMLRRTASNLGTFA